MQQFLVRARPTDSRLTEVLLSLWHQQRISELSARSPLFHFYSSRLCSCSRWLSLLHLFHLLLLSLLLSADSPLTSRHSLPLHSLCKSSLIHVQKHSGSIQPSCSVAMDICSRLTSRTPLSIAFTLAVFMAFAFRLSRWLSARAPCLVLFSVLWRPVIWVQLSANEIWMSDFFLLIFCVPVA